jgi:hypothetical protein
MTTNRSLNKECLSLYEELHGNKGHDQVNFANRSLLHGPLQTRMPQIKLLQILWCIYRSRTMHFTLIHLADL